MWCVAVSLDDLTWVVVWGGGMIAGTGKKGGERGWVWGKDKDAEGGRNIFGLRLVHDWVNFRESKARTENLLVEQMMLWSGWDYEFLLYVWIRNTLKRLRMMGIFFQFYLIQHQISFFPGGWFYYSYWPSLDFVYPFTKPCDMPTSIITPTVGLLMSLPSVLSAPWPYSQSLGLWPIPLLVLEFLWIETLAHS